MATSAQTAPFLPPIEKPSSLFMRLGYYFMRKKFGKVMTPASVFSARMPTTFTTFYGKVGRLDKKLRLPIDTVLLLRERVASTNGCLFCVDATHARALGHSKELAAKFDALVNYATSPLFSPAERAALDYATDLTAHKAVDTDTFAELRRYYNDREICDIVWVVASEHLYTLNNLGLNIGSDGLCEIAATSTRRST
jgi:alkylhydroperoxidase family enzyme